MSALTLSRGCGRRRVAVELEGEENEHRLIPHRRYAAAADDDRRQLARRCAALHERKVAERRAGGDGRIEPLLQRLARPRAATQLRERHARHLLGRELEAVE